MSLQVANIGGYGLSHNTLKQLCSIQYIHMELAVVLEVKFTYNNTWFSEMYELNTLRGAPYQSISACVNPNWEETMLIFSACIVTCL